MIEISMNQIYKNYGFNHILKGASFEIMTGDRTALTGKNGSGKTTLLKILTQEETFDKGTVSIRKGASIGFLEQISQRMEDHVTVKDVLFNSFAYLIELEQKMRDMEQRMSVENDSLTLDRLLKEYNHVQNTFLSLDGYSMEESIQRIIEGFDLGGLLDRAYNVLSSGQKTIVRLAATILKQPDILLLDEPTNHLDIKTLEWFEKFISNYKGTIVFISHDRYFLDKAATKTVLLEDGACQTFHGNYTFSLKERERLLLLEFEDYKNQQKKIDAMKAAIRRFREWGAKHDNEKFFKKAKELEKRLEKIERIEKPKLEKSKIPLNFCTERSGNEVLIVKDFSMAYSQLQLFHNASLNLYYKDRACLMGDNGTGKTSFLHEILGNQKNYIGQLKLGASTAIGYIPQEIRFTDDNATVLETFRNGCHCTEGEGRQILAKYYFYADNVFKKVGILSGGEKVLLKLAILVQKKVNFLVLDEPTNHIDIETREILEETLSEFKGTLLFISHDRYFINKIAKKIIEIKDKKFHTYLGNYEDVQNYQKKCLDKSII